MTGYTKVFNSILTSTIWQEDSDTKVVWVTLLALADANGVADATIPGLANLAGVPLAKTIEAVKKFMAPDPYSRTKTDGGRRIMEVEGGWLLLNHAAYRQRRDPEARRAQNKLAQQRFRDKNADSKPIVSQCKPMSAQAEAEAVTEANNSSAALTSKPSVSKRATEEFDTQFWPNVPTKTGKGAAHKAYIKARKKFPAEVILAGLPKFQAYEDGRKVQPDYRPLHPATWLNQERWADEVAGKETPEETVAKLKAKGFL